MKNIIRILVLLTIFTCSRIAAADAAFLSFYGLVKATPDHPALYGAYYDPQQTIEESETKKPTIMIGSGVSYARYFGNFQFNAKTLFGYTGWYLAQLGLDAPEDETYLLLDSHSDVYMRYFISGRTSVFGGMKYLAIYSQGNYSQDLQEGKNQSTGRVERFTYFQKGYGYQVGFHVYPNIIENFDFYLSPTYAYFPESGNEMEFNLYGNDNDTNKGNYELHFVEVDISFSLTFLESSDGLGGADFGIKNAFYYYIQHTDNSTSQQIYKDDFWYYDLIPYIEITIPL
jgi:hypothetical protein